MKIVPSAPFVLLFAAAAAFTFADQQAYVSRGDALRAAEFIAPGETLFHVCEPCASDDPRTERVVTVEAVDTGYETYWEVLVNGTGIDLAYVYVKRDGAWRNLGLLLGLEVSDVSPVVDDDGRSASSNDSGAESDPGSDLDRAERRLQAVLGDLRASLDEHETELLDRSQAAWLAYRDAMYAYEMTRIDHEGNFEHARAFVLERLTSRRIEDLERDYH